MKLIRETLRGLKTLDGPFVPFAVDDAPEHPTTLFLQWFDVALAHGVPEPHAMILSSADENGYPDARVLILKDVDEIGFHFATSVASRKGGQLECRKEAALTFYWSKLGRQVRLRGEVVELDSRVSASDFLAAHPAPGQQYFSGSRARFCTEKRI